jgi:hypothetical protein
LLNIKVWKYPSLQKSFLKNETIWQWLAKKCFIFIFFTQNWLDPTFLIQHWQVWICFKLNWVNSSCPISTGTFCLSYRFFLHMFWKKKTILCDLAPKVPIKNIFLTIVKSPHILLVYFVFVSFDGLLTRLLWHTVDLKGIQGCKVALIFDLAND